MPQSRTLAQRAASAKQSLTALGRRRAQLDADEEQWKKDARDTIAKAASAGVPKTEVAKMLGVHRTTVYELLG